jgi:DNA-binding PadR family transcriptional regulator
MAVREGLLALLDDGPRHGYQLKTQFEAATGGVWPLNVGQVYTTLDRLERDGLVAATPEEPRGGAGGGPQRLYALTAAGREELGAWWHTVPREDPPPRDELMLKVLMAIEHGRDHALAVITRQRTAIQTLMQQARREQRGRRGALADEGLAAALVADAVAVRAEADLRWLDLCEARLAGQPATHRPTGGTN